MGNSFAIHGLRDEAADERDVDIRQVRVGARPDENNKKLEAKTPTTAESHNGATNAGLEAKEDETERREYTKDSETNEPREHAEGRSAVTVHRSLCDEKEVSDQTKTTGYED